jgi:hypothetical protein
MLSLQALRQSRFIARCVLVWFALSMAAAMAAPVVNPQASVLVCSTSGAVKLVPSGDDSPATATTHAFECVLCFALDAPPAAAPAPQTLAQAAATQAPGPDPAVVPFRSAAPLSARAPPVLF